MISKPETPIIMVYNYKVSRSTNIPSILLKDLIWILFVIKISLGLNNKKLINIEILDFEKKAVYPP